MTTPAHRCPACDGTGMKATDANWTRTCKHCFGSGLAAPIFDQGHAIDHDAYVCGVSRMPTMQALESLDPFWLTLGGSDHDPWGDGGETFRQRAEAVALGIGLNIYAPKEQRQP